MAKRGFANLIMVALTIVLGVILVFNVMLPIMNNQIQANNNASGSGNIAGYTGGVGISQASYVITVLCILALAGGAVLAFFQGTAG